jgi:hypothetical protein
VALVLLQHPAEHAAAPLGFATFAGALTDWETIDDMSVIVTARQQAQDQTVAGTFDVRRLSGGVCRTSEFDGEVNFMPNN